MNLFEKKNEINQNTNIKSFTVLFQFLCRILLKMAVAQHQTRTFLGPYSKAVNLADEDILNNQLHPITEEIKNGLVVEIYEYVKKNSLKLCIFTETIKKIVPQHIRVTESANIDIDLRNKGLKLYKTSKLKGKSKLRDPKPLDNFLNEPYDHPQKKADTAEDLTPRKKKLMSNLQSKTDEVERLKKSLHFSKKESETQQKVIVEKTAEIEQLNQLYDGALTELDEATNRMKNKPTKESVEKLEKVLQEKNDQLNKITVKLSKANVRNLNKKLQRRDNKVASQTELIKDLENKVKENEVKCEELESNLENCKRDKRLLQRRLSYHKNKGYLRSSKNDISNRTRTG